jgi:hypothetical protein
MPSGPVKADYLSSVLFNGDAGANQVAVAVYVIDTADVGPELGFVGEGGGESRLCMDAQFNRRDQNGKYRI